MEIVTSWMEKGIQQGLFTAIVRLLNRQIGEIPPELVAQVEALSKERLEALFDAGFDFQSQADLVQWLRNESSGKVRGKRK